MHRKLSLPDYFYYVETTTKRSYSDQPSGELDPARLLVNLPAFIAPGNTALKNLKPLFCLI